MYMPCKRRASIPKKIRCNSTINSAAKKLHSYLQHSQQRAIDQNSKANDRRTKSFNAYVHSTLLPPEKDMTIILTLGIGQVLMTAMQCIPVLLPYWKPDRGWEKRMIFITSKDFFAEKVKVARRSDFIQ